jgi:hypothetical protein
MIQAMDKSISDDPAGSLVIGLFMIAFGVLVFWIAMRKAERDPQFKGGGFMMGGSLAQIIGGLLFAIASAWHMLAHMGE